MAKGVVRGVELKWWWFRSGDRGFGNGSELLEEALWGFVMVIGSDHRGREKYKHITIQILTEDFRVLFIGHEELLIVSTVGKLRGVKGSCRLLFGGSVGDHGS